MLTHDLQQRYERCLTSTERFSACDASPELLTTAKADPVLAFELHVPNPRFDISDSAKAKETPKIFKDDKVALLASMNASVCISGRLALPPSLKTSEISQNENFFASLRPFHCR